MKAMGPPTSPLRTPKDTVVDLTSLLESPLHLGRQSSLFFAGLQRFQSPQPEAFFECAHFFEKFIIFCLGNKTMKTSGGLWSSRRIWGERVSPQPTPARAARLVNPVTHVGLLLLPAPMERLG